MCYYCDGIQHDPDGETTYLTDDCTPSELLGISTWDSPEGTKLYLEAYNDGYNGMSISCQINYCPMCGKYFGD